MSVRHLSIRSILYLLATAAAVGGYVYFDRFHNRIGESAATGIGAPITTVTVPGTLSAQAQAGKMSYETNCLACHGLNAAGQTGVAPPLVHVIYEPGHHSDESFQRAVSRGVQAHHWRFGDMPPVEGLDRRDVEAIVAYIRELQQANGIY